MTKKWKPKRDPSLKKFMLYGDMGKRFGRVHWIAADNVREAISLMDVRRPGFMAYLRERFDQPFRVIVGDEDRDEKGLYSPVGRTETIKIVPMVRGAKSDGVQMIIGAALIAASFYPPLAWLRPVGMAMMLGGVAEWLSNAPLGLGAGLDNNHTDATNWAFGSPTMTIGQGGCVPVAGGLHMMGGHIISSGVDAQAWSPGGFDKSVCLTDDGQRYGNGDSVPWMWAKDES